MLLISVNELYPLKCAETDGAFFDLTDDGGVFHIFFERPNVAEIADFSIGRVQAAISVIENVIFICFKFGNQNWMDSPYNFNLSNNITAVPTHATTRGLALSVVLVDRKTTVVKALRVLSLGVKFSEMLLALIKEVQKDTPKTKDEHYAIVEKIYGKYSTQQVVNESILHVTL